MEHTARVRSHFATRNRYLATIAKSESNFAGDIKTLPVIDKPHEHGSTYEKMIEKLVGYVTKEFK